MADNSTLIKVGAVGAALYIAYTQGWLSFLGIGTAATATPTATPATSGTPATSAGAVPTTPSAASPSTLDALYTKFLAAAKAGGSDTGTLGVDGWGWYLNQSGITAPDPMPIFSAAVPGFDRSQQFTITQYWAVMAPALKTQLGLSGLGMYGALAGMAWGYR